MAKRFVCPSCGGLAPSEREGCALCGTAYPERVLRLPATMNGRRWVRATFRRKCRSCEQASEVGLLELRGDVVCPHCGKAAHPSEAELRDLLEIAHAVADPKAAQLSQFAGLGSKNTFIDYARDELSMTVSPGHPVCPGCKIPREVDLLGPGRVGLRCPKCSEEHVYHAKWAREANPDLLAWCHPLTEERSAEAPIDGPAPGAYREAERQEPVWLAFRGASPRVARALEPPAPSSRAEARSRRVRDRFRDPKWVRTVWPFVLWLGLAAVCGALLSPLFLGLEAYAYAQQKERASWLPATCKELSTRTVPGRKAAAVYVSVRADLPGGRVETIELGLPEYRPPTAWVVRAFEPEVSSVARPEGEPCFVGVETNPPRAARYRATRLALWPLGALVGVFAASAAVLWLFVKRA